MGRLMTVDFQARSLMLTGPGRLEWVTERLHQPRSDDVLLRTRAGAISMGTELLLYRGQSRGSHPVSYPSMTGYESVADVIACGPEVEALSAGDRVVAFYGHRTAAVTPTTRVVSIPPDISDEIAVLLVLACDSAKGVSRIEVNRQDPVVISGCGAMGLLTLFNLHARGARNITVVEPIRERHELARRFGAREAFDPGDEALSQQVCSVAFECSSSNAAFARLQKMAKPGAQICILADGNLEPLALSPDFHAKELTIVGSSDGLDYDDYAPWFWQMARVGRYPLAGLFEESVAVTELADTFARLAETEKRPLKVFVQYG